MPKAKPKEVIYDTVLDQIKYNLSLLRSAPEGDYNAIKDVVCKFYQSGKCPDCTGCLQPEEKMDECHKQYITRIESRPMALWSKEFAILTIRPKQKVTEIVSMGLSCDACYMSESCPVYEKMALCGIDWEEEGNLTPKEVVDKLIAIQFQRVNRGSKIELIDGGVPDQTLSNEIDRLSALVASRNDLNMDKFQLNINAKTSNSQGQPGILAALLGGKLPAAMPQQQLPENTTIDIPHEQVFPDVIKKEKTS